MQFVKQALKSTLANPVVWRRVVPLLKPQGVTVLTYHSVERTPSIFESMNVDHFREQMVWLKNRCTILDPNDIQSAVKQRGGIPVVITFDDGYKDYHDHAYPILQELQIPAIMFLNSSMHESGGLIWTEVIRWATSISPLASVTRPWEDTGLPHAIQSLDEKRQFARGCNQYLKGIKDEDRRRWLDELIKALNVDLEAHPPPRRMMNWDEVRATAQYTRFGGHSHSHPILSQLSPEQLEAEIRACTELITAHTGVRPTQFAYPNGRAQDFSPAVQDALRRHGYTAAYTTISGINGVDADMFALRRQATGISHINDLSLQVLGSQRH
jgi:peptidoglycan/xylan/chitin deacetylase (PgdA/CDA1 family)